MPRNLHERVEVMFPVRNPALRNRVLGEILHAYLRDNDKARILQADGSYARADSRKTAKHSRNGNRFSAQSHFLDLAEGRSEAKSAEARSAEVRSAETRSEVRAVPANSEARATA
jgi:polyphosphate kinase